MPEGKSYANTVCKTKCPPVPSSLAVAARELTCPLGPMPFVSGEVTERSLYVNNVGTGVSTDLMKAIFPCALKISVAKAGKEAR